MLEELNTAGNLLSAALQRYRTACLAIANSCNPGNPLISKSQSISDAVHSQLELIASHETKVQEVKTIVCQTRNVLPVIVPIAVLPSDILTQIFRLILDDPCCNCWKPGDSSAPSIKYPETLSHVCSRWRRVIINLHALWSHIDIPVPLGRHGVDRQLLNRAKVFAVRALYAPLDIHISSATFRNEIDNTDLYAFCTSIATRMRSLELFAHFSLETVHFMALRRCLADCMPGTLQQLVITGGEKQISWVDRPTDRIIPISAIALPQQHLEGLLRPVNVLRLNGVYFDWTSQVYHGLVELHLTQGSKGFPISITQSHLVKILTASPGLRTFCFGLKITELLSHDVSCSPISLHYLEVADLHLSDYSQYDILFQLMSPSQNPLQLSLYIRSESRSYYGGVFPRGFFAHEFFARTVITELSISGGGGFSCIPLPEFLKSLPLQGLQALFLSVFRFNTSSVDSDSQSSSPVDENELEHLPMCSQLHSLHLEGCIVAFDDLQWVTEIFPLQVLKITHCNVRDKGSRSRTEVQDKLAKMFPAINIK